MKILKVTNLQKTFFGREVNVPVLKQVSFSLEEGSFTALTGISGSGKTTLLHLLAGLIDADKGSISFAGNHLSNLSENERYLFRRRYIGMIFQQSSLLPNLTVEENLILPVILDRGRIPDEERLDRILRLLKLQEQKDRYPFELSGGEKQRAAFGRAVFPRPSLILADEPCAHLDIRQSLETMFLLQECAKHENQTVLMATHNLSLAQLCDRILELKDGYIIHSFGVQYESDPYCDSK